MEKAHLKYESRFGLEISKKIDDEISIAVQFKRAGDFNKANDIYIKLNNQYPNNPIVLKSWAKISVCLGNYNQAIEKYKSASKLYKEFESGEYWQCDEQIKDIKNRYDDPELFKKWVYAVSGGSITNVSLDNKDGDEMKDEIIKEIKNIENLDKRDAQNIDDIVFVDNLQVFFGGGGSDSTDESGTLGNLKTYTVGFGESLSGQMPGRTPIEFLFWAMPDFEQADKNDPLAGLTPWKLPKTGKYDVGITFSVGESDIIGNYAEKANKFTFFTAEVVKKIKSYYLMHCMQNPMGTGIDGYLFLLSDEILHNFIATYLLNYPEDLFKFQNTNALDLSDIDNFNIINKKHLFKRNEQSD